MIPRKTLLFGNIRRTVFITVIIILMILSLSVYLINQIGNKEAENKMIMNAFGEQRLYTQLIAKDANRLYNLIQSIEAKQSDQSEEVTYQRINEIKEDLLRSKQKFSDTLTTIHNGYIQIDKEPINMEKAIHQGSDYLTQIEAIWMEFEAAVGELAEVDQIGDQTTEALAYINEHNMKLLELCEDFQNQILENSLNTTESMKQYIFMTFGILVVVLIYTLYKLIKFVLLPYKQLIHGITAIGLASEAEPVKNLTQKSMLPIVDEISSMFHKINDLITLIENINNSTSFMETLNFINTTFSSFVPYNYIGIALINEDKQMLEASYGVSDETIYGLPGNIKGMRWRINDTSLGKLIETGEARIINDLVDYTAGKELRPYNRILLEAGIRASITLPLKVSGRPVGVIFFSSSKSNVYHGGHLNFLNTLMNSIAISFSRNIMFNDIQYSSTLALAKLAEARDEDTGEHLIRMKSYSKLIGQLLYEAGHSDEVTLEYIEMLERFSPLHDIGKVGISDKILLKPGKLTKDEYNEMKRHTIYGAEVLKTAEINMGKSEKSWFGMGIEIAEGHHERWDGSGYPRGKKGEEIPLSARIVAVADVFDALTSRRPYKEAFDLDTAYGIMLEGRGKHFDPEIIDIFMKNRDQIERLYYQFKYEEKTA